MKTVYLVYKHSFYALNGKGELYGAFFTKRAAVKAQKELGTKLIMKTECKARMDKLTIDGKNSSLEIA